MISWRSARIVGMRAYMPFILVALAVFTAVCIAYFAWELSSDKEDPKEDPKKDSHS